MKKLNLTRLAAAVLVVAGLFTSCKSTPDIAPVDPFELLDGDAALYLSVPVQANREFVTSAIQKVAHVEESDAEKITDRLDTAFVAISALGQVQLSASGKLPSTMLGFALSEKNGWRSGVYNEQVYYTHQPSLYQLCIPSSSNAFLSYDIAPMINRFNKVAFPLNTEVVDAKLLSQGLSESIFSFLHDNKSPDILMYSPLPKSFIKSFLGSDITPPVDSMFAVLSQYRGVKEQFNVRLVINLSDPRTCKATCALLKTMLFGIPAKIVQTGQKQITITDLPVSKDRLLSMLR